MIQGTRIKFTNEATWTDASRHRQARPETMLDRGRGEAGREQMVRRSGAANRHKEVRPGYRGDIKKWNADCPQTEWRPDFNGNPKGPWEEQRLPICSIRRPWTSTHMPPTPLAARAHYLSSPTRSRGHRNIVAPVYGRCSCRPFGCPRYKGRMRPHFTVLPEWICPMK